MQDILLESLKLLGVGLALGLKHAFDSDHLAAVSTIVSRTKSITKSLLTGAFWGLGHTFTLLLVGVAILIFKLAIPQNIGLFFELAVGILLVVLGVNVMYKIKREKIHFHAHTHDGISHGHLHSHNASASHNHGHISFLTGMLHGLAGSATLMFLILATIDSTLKGFLFILVFGFGATLGMTLAGAAISIPFIFSKKAGVLNLVTQITAGSISILIGLNMIWRMGLQGAAW